jgi:uncharacterized metal-binding protein
MPSGRVHDRITAIGAVAAVPIWWFFAPIVSSAVTPRGVTPSAIANLGVREDWAAGVTLFLAILFAGWMLSPDLDLNSSIYHRWGPFRFLWWPYQKVVPHRSWVSHSWLFSPILRVAYLLGVTWLLAYGVLWALSQSTGLGPGVPTRTPIDLVQQLYREFPHPCVLAAVGLVIGTALHSGADTVWSFVKRRH